MTEKREAKYIERTGTKMKVSDFGIYGIDNGDVYLLFKRIGSNNLDWSWFNLDDTVKNEVNGVQVYGKQLRLQEDAIVDTLYGSKCGKLDRNFTLGITEYSECQFNKKTHTADEIGAYNIAIRSIDGNIDSVKMKYDIQTYESYLVKGDTVIDINKCAGVRQLAGFCGELGLESLIQNIQIILDTAERKDGYIGISIYKAVFDWDSSTYLQMVAHSMGKQTVFDLGYTNEGISSNKYDLYSLRHMNVDLDRPGVKSFSYIRCSNLTTKEEDSLMEYDMWLPDRLYVMALLDGEKRLSKMNVIGRDTHTDKIEFILRKTEDGSTVDKSVLLIDNEGCVKDGKNKFSKEVLGHWVLEFSPSLKGRWAVGINHLSNTGKIPSFAFLGI